MTIRKVTNPEGKNKVKQNQEAHSPLIHQMSPLKLKDFSVYSPGRLEKGVRGGEVAGAWNRN